MFRFDEHIICNGDPTATSQRIEEYRDYYKVKYDICKTVQPQVIAEIGVRAGYSAWSFLQAMPSAAYIGIDANNGTHGGQGGEDGSYAVWARRILCDYDCRFIQLDTQKVNELPLEQVDLFHIDGDHSTRGVIHDLNLAFRCLSEKGILLVDDITYIPEVKDGVELWVKQMQSRIEVEYIESLRGECVIRKQR